MDKARGLLSLIAVLAGSLVAAGPADEPKANDALKLKLATFNIHFAEGTDGVLDLKRVADLVRGADIVAFQEVDVRFRPRSRLVDQATALAKELGGHHAFGANLIEGEGQYGVALVSKFPIVSSENHRLPRSEGREKAEPRGLLETVLDVRGRPLRVFVTHLAHDSKPDRLLQIDRIKAALRDASGPWILMGDLNFRPDSEEYSRLFGRDGDEPRPVDAWTRVGKGAGPTIGLAGKNPGRIDYVIVSPDLADGLTSARVDSETKASDHQPLFVEIHWKPAK